MRDRKKWLRAIYIAGVVAIIIGTIDPLEGSVLIVAGSVLLSLTTYLNQNRFWKIYFAAMVMIITGVICMFYFSSLGGFGGKSALSWWWITLVIPYPAGWLMCVITLLVELFNKKKKQTLYNNYG